MTAHTAIRPPLLETIDALIEHYATNGRIEAAKVWTEMRAGAVGLADTIPGAMNLYRHWVREACRETGVEYNA